jgi:hypothetical protein
MLKAPDSQPEMMMRCFSDLSFLLMPPDQARSLAQIGLELGLEMAYPASFEMPSGRRWISGESLS